MWKKLKICFLIYTYNRVSDAKMNIKIIRELWKKSNLFAEIKIVHAFNGQKSWYPQKGLEDKLLRTKNSGRYQGAAELIDSGFEEIFKSFSDFDYAITLASDTWLLKPKYIFQILQTMKKKKLYLADCSWGKPKRQNIFEVGAATDFFVVEINWAKQYKLFPIDYKTFDEKYAEVVLYQKGSNVLVEKLFLTRFLQAIFREIPDHNDRKANALSKLYRLIDREPVHVNEKWRRKHFWPKMGLITHHDFKKKMKIFNTYYRP